MGKGPSSKQADAAVFSRLREENEALKKEVARLREKLERMNELLLNAQRARFGQSSEKQAYVMKDSRQLGLFNEAEMEQVFLVGERIGYAIIPCDEFSCPSKFTNRDTINWTCPGKNMTTGLEHKEAHYGRINLYASRRLLHSQPDT